MAEIKASDVKNLREKTGAGMMDCKKALAECGGDFEEAVVWLRKKGLSAASKKSGRVAAEGLVGLITKGTEGSVIELNAETDFVARNDKFQELANGILSVSLECKGELNKIITSNFLGKNITVADQITESIAVIGENMNLRRAKYLTVDNGVVVGYIHNEIANNLGKIAVLIALKSDADKSALTEIGKKIAMHAAAMRPEALDISSVDPANVQKEKDIFSEQALKSGKPASIVEKMVEGRIRKYYEEVVLLEQVFVMDNKLKISEYLEQESKKLSSSIKLTEFVRYELGEGIEQVQGDFAAEVASMVK